MQILESARDIKCLGAFASAEDALPQIVAKPPDVVLMDIKLPKMSGIQCVAEIKKVLPAMQIIMVTVYEDSERIFRALKAGANGYLVKSSPPEQLLAAIRDVSTGGAPMSSHIANKVVQTFSHDWKFADGIRKSFTPRTGGAGIAGVRFHLQRDRRQTEYWHRNRAHLCQKHLPEDACAQPTGSRGQAQVRILLKCLFQGENGGQNRLRIATNVYGIFTGFDFPFLVDVPNRQI